MTKRIIGLLLALLLLACMPALAEEPKWSYDNDNMYLKLDGDLSGDVTIPSEVDGYLVNAIEDNAFHEQHEITSLTMPDSLRALKGGVISSMGSLTQVTLNDGLEYLGVKLDAEKNKLRDRSGQRAHRGRRLLQLRKSERDPL